MHVAVFCGLNIGRRPEFSDAAYQLGVALAARGCNLIYGGSAHGLMGRLADGALAGGAQIIGVIPRDLHEIEGVHPRLSALQLVNSLHERKLLQSHMAEAFVALPGGLGTLDELVEIWTWRQLGYHHKPIGILNVGNFYSTFLAFLDEAVHEGMFKSANKDIPLVVANPDQLVDKLIEARRT